MRFSAVGVDPDKEDVFSFTKNLEAKDFERFENLCLWCVDRKLVRQALNSASVMKASEMGRSDCSASMPRVSA